MVMCKGGNKGRGRKEIRTKVLILAASVSSIMVASPATAQVPRVEQDPAQRLLQEQRERDRQREIEQPPAQIQTPRRDAPAPTRSDIEQIPETGPTFLIEHIDFAGDAVLPASELDSIAQPFLNKRLGSARINQLLRRLTERFVNDGLITSRAYLGEQNLRSGTLVITLVSGKIEAIQLNGQQISPRASGAKPDSGGWLTDFGVRMAIPAAPDDVLHLTDLEQGVEQINRMRRNKAEMQILPGSSPGGSIIGIKNTAGDRLWFSAGIDNYGSQQTGLNRTRLGVEADNLLGFQEVVSFNYSGSRETNALVGSASVPLGYNTFSYTTSLSEYQALISDTALLYGKTLASSWGWNRVLSRNQASKLALDVTLSLRRSERDINNLPLAPQKLSVLRVAINKLWRFVIEKRPASLTLEGGLSRGLSGFGADKDSSQIQDSEAHGQFTKLDVNGSFSFALPSTDIAQFMMRMQVNGQWTRQALFGSEQIFVGGMSSVRGFRESGVSGDRGAYSRNEIVWSNTPSVADVRIEPYIFLDTGITELIAEGHTRRLSGLGLGTRLQYQSGKHAWTSELTLGRPVQQPNFLPRRETLLLATLNWSY